MQKLFFIFFTTILLLQTFADAFLLHDAADSLASKDEDSFGVALRKTYHPVKINCNYACAGRCKKASRTNMCSRACKTCCARCQCVPAGTYGNKNACPCYARLKTHGRQPKCP